MSYICNMRIKELNKGNLPVNYTTIYPDFEERASFIKKYDGSGYSYLYSRSTLVKIIRDNIEYLIPYRRFYETAAETNTEEIDVSKFKEFSNKDCIQIIEKYKIPEDESELLDTYGREILIYKWK